MKRFWSIILSFVLLLTSVPTISMKSKAASDTGKNYSFTSANGELSISFREVKDNDYWYEYYVTVTNNSSRSICDWSIVLNCSNPSAFSKGFECTAKADGSAGTVTVSGTGNYKVVGAGSTLSNSSSFKLGFGSSVSFAGGQITYNYGTSSSVDDSANGVGYGNTYIDGYSCNYTLTGETKNLAMSETPLGKHGALHVDGTQLKDEHNQKMILRGASTHGMHWGEMSPFVNKTAFQNLRDEWGVNMVRLVNYVTQGGYTKGSQSVLDDCIQRGVSYADDLGMYAIIDWHIRNEDPNDTKSAAITFFNKYSKLYADHDNILYEICNEPTGTAWPQIKSYAEDVIETIRTNDPDAIIIVGTNTWSQDVDEVATNGGKINDANTMYTIHFYSGTHGQSLRDKVQTALNAGTPIFCTEFGVCDASGNGSFNLNEADAWIDFFEDKGISYCCWSLCNKDESASYISPQSPKKYGWTNEDLGATGAWLINTYRKKAGDEPEETPAPTSTPTVAPTTEPTQTPSGTATPMPTSTPTTAPTNTPGNYVDGESVVLMENGDANEAYSPSDINWFLNAKDEDKITVTYTCDNAEYSNWGIMHWGATIDGDWKESTYHYSAGSPATETVTKTMTVGEIRESLGATETGAINGLMLLAYNDARIIRLTYTPVVEVGATSTPTVAPTEMPEPTPVVTPTVTPTVEPTPVVTPTVAPTEEPKVTSSATPSEIPNSSQNLGNKSEEEKVPSVLPKLGEFLNSTKYKAIFKVTGVSGDYTVEYYRSTNKKEKSLVIPKKVTINGITYKVTSIAKKAFYKNKKIKRIIIPNSIVKIGMQAFYKCKKLKKIVIKTSKLKKKSIGKKAFKGIHKKANIKIPKKKKKVYQKYLRKAGMPKKVKVQIAPFR